MTSATMRAAVATDQGLVVQSLPRPAPKPNEVLVKVSHAGLNRADLMGARYLPAGASGPFVPGIDFAGEVVALGTAAQGVKIGDRVMGGGSAAYAEFAATDAGRVMPIPPNYSGEQAAAATVALITMHNALVTMGRLEAGESVLIQGATSGVGLMAMKIARLCGAKTVIGTGRNAERLARLKDHGADLALDTTNPDWPQAVLDATGGRGVDLAIDQVSGNLVTPLMNATAIRGRIVNVGRLGGAVAEFDFNLHALRRIDYIGVTFRTRSLDEIRTIHGAVRADLSAAIAAGKLDLPIDRVFPLEDAQAAQDYMRANRHFGKVVLQM